MNTKVLGAIWLQSLIIAVVGTLSAGVGLASVNQVWTEEYYVTRYSYYEKAVDLGIDSQGNVIVTGWKQPSPIQAITVKYAPDGTKIWDRYSGGYPVELAIDNNDNTYVLSKYPRTIYGQYDYDISKITQNNVYSYKRYDSGYDDVPVAIVADSNGNIIVTGKSFEAIGTTGRRPVIATLKYDSAGEVQWTQTFNRADFSVNEFVQDVVVDDDNNVYVLGTAWNATWSESDFLIIKYSPDGTELWSQFYDDGNSDDRASAAAVDLSGDLVVTGTVMKDDGTYNAKYATAKFSSVDGTLTWISYYDGQPEGRDQAYKISVDPSGAIVVSGISQKNSDEPSGDYGFAVVKYDAAGNEAWSYLSFGALIDRFRGFGDMEIDKDGNVILAGARIWRSGTSNHTFKLSSEGVYLWSRDYYEGVFPDDSARAVATDKYGDIYVTGYTYSLGDPRAGQSYSFNYFTIKYSEYPAPVADAGERQVVDEGTPGVQLDGSNSSGAVNYSWQQLAGTSVELYYPTADMAKPMFDAPYVTRNDFLTFRLTVDNGVGVFDTDDVVIVIEDTNLPPVSDAGDDGTIKEGAVGSLDGCQSYDPETLPLSYRWTQLEGVSVELIPSDLVCNPAFTAPAAGNVLTFQLRVRDGYLFSNVDDVTITVVENSPPVADAGIDQTVLEGAKVYLDGSSSYDPDGGDTLHFSWDAPTGLELIDAETSNPSFFAPSVEAGGDLLQINLTVTDDDPVNPKSDVDQVVINVLNANDPPNCTLAAASCDESKLTDNSGCNLWPPNHSMVPVSIVGISDPDNDTLSVQVTRVTQDEPVNGGGDGESVPDAVVIGEQVLLRAERTGLAGGVADNGRVYNVHFTVDDGQGGTCSGSVDVGVPHDRKDTPHDDGQAYDSTIQ